MSSTDWIVKIITKEMNRCGFDLVLKREVESGYDVDTSSQAYVISEFICRGIMFDYPLKSNGEATHTNTLISKDDKQLFIQPPLTTTEPLSLLDDINPETDQVVIGDLVYKVVSVRQINPTSAYPCVWELYLRK